tara:strand:- start:150 stop:623 length:474 start_codon:yes stop_codon:yes gene_type:complete
MFIWPVPKGAAPDHFVLVSQHQDASFVLTFLGDYQANPTGANPYMVLTAFTELIDTKGICLIRGDLISHLSEDEGQTIMEKLLNSYLRDSEYETIRKFNQEPDKFDYEEYIKQSLAEFAQLKKHIIENKPEKINLGEYKKHGHKTDKELNITKGGII